VIEQRVRAELHERLDILEVLAPSWSTLVVESGRRRRRRAWRSLSVAAIAIIAAVAVIVPGVLLGALRDRHVPDSPGRIQTRIVQTASVQVTYSDGITGMGRAGGRVWIADWGSGRVFGVDPTQRRAAIESVITRLADSGPLSLATGFGSVWVLDFKHGRLLRIDPVTGRIRQRIGHGWDGSVAAGAGAVWVAHSGRSGGTFEHLTRIDPATGRITGTVGLPGEGEVPHVFAGGNQVWVQSERTPLVGINPRTLRRTATVTGLSSVTSVAVGPDGTWAADGGSLYLVRGEAADLFHGPSVESLAIRRGGLWATGHGSLFALNEAGRSIARVQLPNRPTALVGDPSGAFVMTGAHLRRFRLLDDASYRQPGVPDAVWRQALQLSRSVGPHEPAEVVWTEMTRGEWRHIEHTVSTEDPSALMYVVELRSRVLLVCQACSVPPGARTPTGRYAVAANPVDGHGSSSAGLLRADPLRGRSVRVVARQM
jgi:hypothetical protein